MSFRQFDVVQVPFPFLEQPAVKTRPALVLSTEYFNSKSPWIICAMITSAGRSSCAFDIPLACWSEAGLKKPSIVRWKTFTIEQSIVIEKRGSLDPEDKETLFEIMRSLFR